MTVRLLQTLRNHATGAPAHPTTQKPTYNDEDPLDATESTVLENDMAESLETVVVELQHDLRAKSAQCDVLRDTLSAMSQQLQEQGGKFDESKEELQQQLQAAKDDLIKQERLLDMKKSAWERSEERYEEIIEKKEEEVAEWKTKYDDLMLQFEEKIEQARKAAQSAPDALLGSMGSSDASPSFGYDSLEELRKQRPQQGLSDDDDDSLRGGLYGELDSTERPSGFTNRTRPYRRKKRGHPIKKFKMMPMTWLGNSNNNAEVEAAEEAQAEEEANKLQAFNEQMEAMSLADMYTDDEDEEEEEDDDDEDVAPVAAVVPPSATKHDAELRRRRVRRAAKKKSINQGFAVEKLEC